MAGLSQTRPPLPPLRLSRWHVCKAANWSVFVPPSSIDPIICAQGLSYPQAWLCVRVNFFRSEGLLIYVLATGVGCDLWSGRANLHVGCVGLYRHSMLSPHLARASCCPRSSTLARPGITGDQLAQPWFPCHTDVPGCAEYLLRLNRCQCLCLRIARRGFVFCSLGFRHSFFATLSNLLPP